MTYTDKPDYWSLLGLEPGSDPGLLKRAFRREARRWHPDLNGNDLRAEERFKLVNEAYAVLSDPRKREAWEHSLISDNAQLDPFLKGFPSFNEYIEIVLGLDDNYSNSEAEYSSSTEHVQWPATSEPSPPPVQIYEDLESTVELTPSEALNGTTIELELENGTVVQVQTPPFAGDGWRLRLSGIARGLKDHFIQLRVITEDGLRIDGLRVLYKLELLPPDAVLGCAVDIPTLDGPVTLQVPPRSSSGRLLRLRGRGMEYEGKLGDQLVEIVVIIPADLSDSERALYSRLQELAIDPESI